MGKNSWMWAEWTNFFFQSNSVRMQILRMKKFHVIRKRRIVAWNSIASEKKELIMMNKRMMMNVENWNYDSTVIVKEKEMREIRVKKFNLKFHLCTIFALKFFLWMIKFLFWKDKQNFNMKKTSSNKKWWKTNLILD